MEETMSTEDRRRLERGQLQRLVEQVPEVRPAAIIWAADGGRLHLHFSAQADADGLLNSPNFEGRIWEILGHKEISVFIDQALIWSATIA